MLLFSCASERAIRVPLLATVAYANASSNANAVRTILLGFRLGYNAEQFECSPFTTDTVPAEAGDLVRESTCFVTTNLRVCRTLPILGVRM